VYNQYKFLLTLRKLFIEIGEEIVIWHLGKSLKYGWSCSKAGIRDYGWL